MADISRSELSTIIQEEYSNELLASAASNSVALQIFRRVDMGTNIRNLPVLATLPEAGFVAESATESDGVKPTAQVTWTNKILTAEEIAVIIPIHENAVDDASVDVLDAITSEAGAAIGRKLDEAIMFGTDKPASWTSDDLLAAATAASQTVTVSATPGEDDLAGAILQAAEMVDIAGWEPDGFAAPRGMRYRLANLRADDGQPVYRGPLSAGPDDGGQVLGLNAAWVSGRVWDRDEAECFVVDTSRVILGVRQDITVKFLDQATVGGINLAERDMVALRFKARYAYVLGDNTNAESNATNAPVAAVLPAGS